MWKLPLFEACTSIIGSVDSHLVMVFQDSGKKAILPRGDQGNWVKRLQKSGVFEGKLGSLQFIRFAVKNSDQSALVIGLGTGSLLSEEKLRGVGGNVWTRLVSEKANTGVVYVDNLFQVKGAEFGLKNSRSIRAFAEGIILGAYQFKKYKSKEPVNSSYFGPSRFVFFTQNKKLKAELDFELRQVAAIGESVRVTRDWSNEPSNFGTPIYYAEQAKKLAEQNGLKCRILTEKDAEREKMGLFLGVGQGAEREGRILVVEYSPKSQKKTQTIALVGKGVTFDSGGISIKPSARMEDMKHDMTGAATVMGATLLAAKWKVRHRIISIMAFTENMPSGNAIQPGNVLTARNGKTVEVINTDAEGRLILADALDFVQDYKPDAVIDVATLTGAVSVALGKLCCGLLGNDDRLIQSILKASERSGERIWQLPLFDEYFDDLKSDCADMKNSANDSYGGTVRAAIFLKQFIRKGIRWAHLDIASTAYNLTHLSYYPKKGASGAYVRTLAQFISDFE